jgi:hypothetical protein
MKFRSALVAISGCLSLLMACSGPAPPPAETGGTPPAASDSRTTPAAGNIDCYQIGYRYGVCAAKNTHDGSCDPARQAPIPPECRPRSETQQGIKDGLRSIQMQYRRPGS